LKHNPYSSKEVGKTMGDVIMKICKEIEVDPEMIELVIANTLPARELPITLVYEQIWWPHICRLRDPDQYDIPNIEEASEEQLKPMEITFRLMGIDGEATENRIESLQAPGETKN